MHGVLRLIYLTEGTMSLYYENASAKALYVNETPDTEFLDDVLDLFRAGHLETGMDILVPNLHFLYTTTSTDEWQNLVSHVLLTHPVRDYLMQDPLTARSFSQPRGYAGDSKLLDMVYFPRSYDLKTTSDFGKRLFKYTTNTSLSRTLCKRMKLIASYIDDFSSNVPGARILSVASGHCREASYSSALKSRKLRRFVALDHDLNSLATMQRDYSGLGLESLQLNVKDLITGKHALGEYDLIYSAGLYDYLGTRFAQKLTERLYHMLAPGGRLMLINIASSYDEIGYLESYMNWEMIGRDKIDTIGLADSVQSNENAVIQIKDSDLINSHYQMLELQKR